MEKGLSCISLNNISLRFGANNVLNNLTTDLPENEISCLFGPSGVGKTSILNIIAGLIKPQQGEVTTPKDAVFSYIFQEPRLLPWKNVLSNIAFPISRTEKRRIEIAKKYLVLVGLKGYEGYFPAQLSGGMKQRVAIARAFAFPSNILIMDEPFKGLDVPTKLKVMEVFVHLWEKDKRTVVFVSHDIDEAANISQHIVMLHSKPAKIKTILHANNYPNKELLKEAIIDEML